MPKFLNEDSSDVYAKWNTFVKIYNGLLDSYVPLSVDSHRNNEINIKKVNTIKKLPLLELFYVKEIRKLLLMLEKIQKHFGLMSANALK